MTADSNNIAQTSLLSGGFLSGGAGLATGTGSRSDQLRTRISNLEAQLTALDNQETFQNLQRLTENNGNNEGQDPLAATLQQSIITQNAETRRAEIEGEIARLQQELEAAKREEEAERQEEIAQQRRDKEAQQQANLAKKRQQERAEANRLTELRLARQRQTT